MKNKDMIKTLEKEGYVITKPEKIIIKGKEWIKPEKYTDDYNEIKIPKGYRLPTISEMFELNKKELKTLFPDYGENFISIPCQQTEVDKENKASRWFCLDRNSSLYSDYSGLGSSYGDGRVVFIKEKK